MTSTTTPTFDAAGYKSTTRTQWEQAAEAWHRWGPSIEAWLGEATELMLDLAGVQEGSRVVDIAASARAASGDARVTYRSVRERDTGAYGVRLERASPVGDAFVDVERRADAVHVLRAEGVRAIVLARGALGASVERPPPIVVDEAGGVTARWDVP